MYSVATFDSSHISSRFCWFCYIEAMSYSIVNDNFLHWTLQFLDSFNIILLILTKDIELSRLVDDFLPFFFGVYEKGTFLLEELTIFKQIFRCGRFQRCVCYSAILLIFWSISLGFVLVIFCIVYILLSFYRCIMKNMICGSLMLNHANSQSINHQ